MEQQAKKSFIINVIFTFFIGFIIYISGKFLFGYLFPFVIGTIFAWLVQKPAGFISKKISLKKGRCAAFLYAFLYLFVAFILFFGLFRLALGLKGVINEIPKIFEFFEDFVSGIKNRINMLSGGVSDGVAHQINDMITEMIQKVRVRITDWISGMAASVASGLPSFLFSSVVTLVAGCYISKDFEPLTEFLRGIWGEKIHSNFLKIKDIFVKSVLKLMKGYIILMLLTFLELTLGFAIIRVKHTLLIAALISFVDLLPVFGVGTVLIPWSVAELILGNTSRGMGILIIYLIISLVRNFAEPKIIGNQMGINPLFTLIAMFAGLKIFGFWGLFIFPVALIVIIKYYKDEMELEKVSLN